MATLYGALIVFVLVVLLPVALISRIPIRRFWMFVKEPWLIAFSTASSEAALPKALENMEKFGVPKHIVSFVLPTGYSFNLDGTNIYMAMAAVFLAQATNTPLTIGGQIYLLLIAMITSKGASGVTGAGFITLAATLAIVPEVPVAGMALILGIDRFMSEARALTNLVGNAVATLVVARWTGSLEPVPGHAVFRASGPVPPQAT